jgi:hypothetical protein
LGFVGDLVWDFSVMVEDYKKSNNLEKGILKWVR